MQCVGQQGRRCSIIYGFLFTLGIAGCWLDLFGFASVGVIDHAAVASHLHELRKGYAFVALLLSAMLLLLLTMQGTLRAALDHGGVMDKATGCQHLPSVLSLAHNVACAMTYLHQARAMALGFASSQQYIIAYHVQNSFCSLRHVLQQFVLAGRPAVEDISTKC
jgi:hypothetical protein